jgi:hypothetical protein
MPVQAATQFRPLFAEKSGAGTGASVLNAVAGKIWNTITLSPSQKAAATPLATLNCSAKIATEPKAI